MNAKILILALLATATSLPAQVPPPPAAPRLTFEELQRRATNNAATNAPATEAKAAGISDWSATNATQPANAALTAATNSGAQDAERQLAAKRIAELRAARQLTNAVAANHPPTNTVKKAQLAAPRGFPPTGSAAAPARPAPVVQQSPAIIPSAATPDMTMVVRPPASADVIPDADSIVPTGSIDWTAAPLESVLSIYATYVGRNLLRPTALNTKTEIVLKQTTPLTKLEVVQMIEAVLYLNQVSVINVGSKFVTAMPTAEASKIPGSLNTNNVNSLPLLGSVITHVVQLKYTKPSELMQTLTPFISGSVPNPIQPLDSSGMLVLRDNVANVKRMLEMIEKVDVVVQSEILSEVIPIKYAKAEEIASALSSVGGSTSGTVGTRSSSSRPSGASRTGMGGMGGLGGTGYNPNNPGGMQTGQPTPTPSSNATLGDRVRNLLTKAAGSGDFSILGETKIIADIRSNSLLVFASKQDMQMIKDIIAKLDVVLAQVLIETIIMDVSLGNELTLGVTAGQPPKSNGDVTSGGLYNNSGQLATLNDFLTKNPASTNLSGIFPNASGLNYFGRFGGDLDVAVTALASDSRVNVIQKPRIQTSHATPASLFVGETVPYISSTYYGGGYGGGPSSSYQQLRVGIQLTVTPFINQDGLVVMTIEETIDEISGTVTIDNNPVPATTSRTLSAEVAVRDKETIILGGFIRNSDNKSKAGVPLLKDIPLLGALFRSTSSTKARKELIVLMRPTVLRTPDAASLQVDVEKHRLPGVVSAEKELDKWEIEHAKREQKKFKSSKDSNLIVEPVTPPEPNFNKVTPFTPEEEKMLYSPPANTP